MLILEKRAKNSWAECPAWNFRKRKQNKPKEHRRKQIISLRVENNKLENKDTK